MVSTTKIKRYEEALKYMADAGCGLLEIAYDKFFKNCFDNFGKNANREDICFSCYAKKVLQKGDK